MVSLVIFQSLPNGSGYDVLAEATVRRGKLETRGRRDDLIDTTRKVYSERRRRAVSFDKDPEEWLRSFASTFRTAQVGAAILRDTAHSELQAPKAFIEEVAGIRA